MDTPPANPDPLKRPERRVRISLDLADPSEARADSGATVGIMSRKFCNPHIDSVAPPH